MTPAIWILSVPLIAEFVFAPANLWTGRTMSNYTRFTGLPGRRDPAGLAGFAVFGTLACALLALRIAA